MHCDGDDGDGDGDGGDDDDDGDDGCHRFTVHCVPLQCGIRGGAIICGGAKEDAINAIARAVHSALCRGTQ